jgi:serine/threonine protein kinase
MNKEFFLVNIFKQMITSCANLYLKFGIIHRDIKLGNFLILPYSNKVVLIDFGMATDEEAVTNCGTPGF